MFKSILVPITSSRASPQKTQTAINFSIDNISHLIILSITECKVSTTNAKEAIHYAKTLITDFICHNDLICDVIHRLGKPEDIICEIANASKVDLIVMGATKIDLIKDSQNTTSKVIETSPCPVLVVP